VGDRDAPNAWDSGAALRYNPSANSGKRTMRVLFLPKYGRRAASSRLRFFQFLPYLESRGVICQVAPLFDDDYVARRGRTKAGAARAAGLARLAGAFARRARLLRNARDFDLVFMHCEAFPYMPSVLERYMARHRLPYLVDYDDAIFHNYDLNTNPLVRHLLGNKIADILRGAAGVIAGSEYLAEYARRVNDRVWVLPTVVDLDRYPVNVQTQSHVPYTVGWIGSFSTASYLKLVEEPLRMLSKAGGKFVAVGARRPDLDIEPMEFRAWSEETEIADGLSFDVGIMPVPDTPWARGKCGYKLIQYMACGLPVVASPVGVNCDIIEPGRTGFLAGTATEWQKSLETLRTNVSEARQMGQQGRRKVEEKYCLAVTAPQLLQRMRECTTGDR
jgi:glycosyltransferase involved in cell wall biosynthesis